MLWTAQCVFVPLFTTGAYQSASVCRVGSAPLVPDQRTSPAIAIAHVLPLDANVAVLQKPDVVIAPIVFPVDMAVCPSTSVHVGVINRERPSPIVGRVVFPPFGDEAIAESSSDAHDAVFVRVFALVQLAANASGIKLADKTGQIIRTESYLLKAWLTQSGQALSSP